MIYAQGRPVTPNNLNIYVPIYKYVMSANPRKVTVNDWKNWPFDQTRRVFLSHYQSSNLSHPSVLVTKTDSSSLYDGRCNYDIGLFYNNRWYHIEDAPKNSPLNSPISYIPGRFMYFA